MKLLIAIAALLPLTCLAQPLNSMNNPNLPGYQNPTVTRMNQQMNNQQIQQQSMLNQGVRNSATLQGQRLQSQMNSDTQRVLNDSPGQQSITGSGGGMLNGNSSQQHMLNH